MPFIAIDSEVRKRISYELKPREYRQDWWCPHCWEMFSFVNTSTKTKHFRHPPSSNCLSEPESKEHLDLKRYVFEDLKQSRYKVEYEYRIDSQIADVAVFLDNGIIVFECQVSPLSLSSLLGKTFDYLKSDVFPVWLLHPKYHKRYMERNQDFYYKLSRIGSLLKDISWVLWYSENSSSLQRIEFSPKFGIDPFGEEYECKTMFYVEKGKSLSPTEVIGEFNTSIPSYFADMWDIQDLEEGD